MASPVSSASQPDRGTHTARDKLEQLTGVLHFSEIPQQLSLDDATIQGLQDFERRSDESGGGEVAGLTYVDTQNHPRFVELEESGDSDRVLVSFFDLASVLNERNLEKLNEMLPYLGDPRFKGFVLLPEDSRLIPPGIPLGRRNTVRKGRAICSDFHFHPSGNPPSAGDFALAVFSNSYPGKGIVADGQLYLFVMSEETVIPSYPVNPEDKREPVDRFAEELQAELEAFAAEKGTTEEAARVTFWIQKCKEYKVAFFWGKLEDNSFIRLDLT